MKKKLAASFMLVAAVTGFSVLATRELERWLGVWAIFFSVSAIVLIGQLAASWLSHRLSARLAALARAARVIADGDLTTAVPPPREGARSDEIDDLTRSFQQMRGALIGVISELNDTAALIHDSAQRLSATARSLSSFTEGLAGTAARLAQGAETTVTRIQEAHRLTHDVALGAETIGQGAGTALAATRQSGEQARRGRELARRADEELEHISRQVDRTATAVEGFREQALSINKAVDLIATIAQQTHLVALNAALEAARAGEHGQGFAVVADEVRRLADRGARLAEQISGLSLQINSGSGLVIETMRETTAAASHGREVVAGASDALREISDRVLQLVERVDEIATLSHQQGEAIQRLVPAIGEITSIAQEGAAGTEETSRATRQQNESMEAMAHAAVELAGASERLREICSIFRLTGMR
ncbi:MAG: methyl-accepting chemotaxis protein [Acidobacteriota bacterium]|nr:MAG: methyl-accepting chemotaxis protein [Acidobacteriota bacterium]